MNIEDFVKKKNDLVQSSVEYKGTQIHFHIRPEMAFDQVSLFENAGDIFSLSVKQKEAKERGETYMGTGKEIADMQKYRARQVLQLMCKSNGAPVFASLDDLLRSMKPELIALIGEKIDKVTGDKGVEEAEKNS